MKSHVKVLTCCCYCHHCCFKFILACWLLGGSLLVSADLNKRSKHFTNGVCRYSVDLLLMVDLGTTECSYLIPFLIVPSAPVITGTIFVLICHILLTSFSRSLYCTC